jgi:hypothetical protein
MTGWQPFIFGILSITACVLPRKAASNDIGIYGTEEMLEIFFRRSEFRSKKFARKAPLT